MEFVDELKSGFKSFEYLMVLRMALRKYGVEMVSKMYIELDNGGVSPNGANHNPRRLASRKWCVVNAINNMLIHNE